jgi:hypothetical protein
MGTLGSLLNVLCTCRRPIGKSDLHVDKVAFFGFHSLSNILVTVLLFTATTFFRLLIKLAFSRYSSVVLLVPFRLQLAVFSD